MGQTISELEKQIFELTTRLNELRKSNTGAVVYERDGDTVTRRNSCIFGPGDLYCSMWGLIALAGRDAGNWTPQYSYWKRPDSMDDGGANLND